MKNDSVRSVCPYCGVGCGIILKTDGQKVIGVSGDKDHPANFGRLCTKGLTCVEPLSSPDRLREAFHRDRRSDPFLTLGVTDAHDLVARRFREIIDAHGPDAVSFYVSGQMSTESQYLANKLAKGFIGTNNIDSNSRLCMSSAASGYRLSIGADAPPGSYEDFERTNCFLVMGANMADCHPILFLRLLDRKKADGVKLIVVDPRRNATADKADLYLPIKPGTDLAFLNGLLYLLQQNGHLDHSFLEAHTEGWAELAALLPHYPPEVVAALTGLSESDLRLAARWFGESPECLTLWTMGLNQSTHGTWQTNAICNLHLATGKICRPGSGPFSLTGQPNAMGGREVGYLSGGLPGQRNVAVAEDRSWTENFWGLPAGRIQPLPGPDAVALFKKLASGQVKAIWIICTNPVASMPNRDLVIAGLQRAEFVVVQEVFQETETSQFAHVLLPGALWAEADGTMVNSERNVSLMQAAQPPPGDALADWQHLREVAVRMGFAEAFDFPSAAEVFREITATVNPLTGYDLRGLTYDRLRQGSQQWPCGPGELKGPKIRYLGTGQLRFPTATGRGKLWARPFLPPAELPDAEYPMVLTTGRLPHHWHTLTKTGRVPTLTRLHPGPFLELHPEDAAAFEIKTDDLVSVRSRRSQFIYPARVSDRIRAGTCFAPFHWADLFGEQWAVNAVTSDAQDPISLQPELKFCAVQLQRVEAAQPDPFPGFTSEQSAFLRIFWNDLPPYAQTVTSVLDQAPFSDQQKEVLSRMLAGKPSE